MGISRGITLPKNISMRIFLILIFLGTFCNVSFAQSRSIVGSWFWSDSTQETSLFFKKDGRVLTHTGPKGYPILTKNLREGKYVLKGDQLVIKWIDSSETNQLIFIDKYSFKLIRNPRVKNSRTYFYRKVGDAEN
jgi:hypothetical protein